MSYGFLNATQQYIQQVAGVETLNITHTDFAPTHAETAQTLSVTQAAEMVKTAPAGTIRSTRFSNRSQESSQDSTETAIWQQISNAVLQFLDQPTRYFDNFFVDYKKPVLSLAILLGFGMTYKVLNSMLAAIDDVPGLAGLFQLIGLGYSIQFWGCVRCLKKKDAIAY